MTDQHATPPVATNAELAAPIIPTDLELMNVEAAVTLGESTSLLGDIAAIQAGRRAVYNRGTNDGFTIAQFGFLAQQTEVVRETAEERARQDARWGVTSHPDGTGLTARPLGDFIHRKAGFGWSSLGAMTAPALAAAATENTNVAFAQDQGTWTDILLEEVFEALAAADPAKLRRELIQVAAVAQAWVEDIDRRPDSTRLPADTVVLIDPDCAAGKHDNCSGNGFDVGADQPAPCPCRCHTKDA
jgi:hypothetical protein